MNVDLTQYYNSLVDKDSERIPYFYDVVAVNKTSNIQNTICSIAQNPKKATGAERFKELVAKAENQKYDVLKVKEYGADGQRIVNNFVFQLKSGGKKKGNGKQNLPMVQPVINQCDTLDGFESTLGRLGFVNGFDGVIAASAEKMNQSFILNQQSAQISDLKTEIGLLKQERESLRKEAEQYKERYKEILDEKKDMERDHKSVVAELTNQNKLGSLAVNGLLGFISSRPGVANMLAGVFGPAGASQHPATPQTATPASNTSAPSDDDDDITPVSSDPKVQAYMEYISKYCTSLSVGDLEKVATVIQFAQIPGNLDYLVIHCKQKYNESKQQNNGSNN